METNPAPEATETAPRKRGRKPLPPEIRRSVPIVIHVSPQERERLQGAKGDQSMAAFARKSMGLEA